MMRALFALVLVSALGACAQVDLAVDRAAELKRRANDEQVKIWLLAACDLPLGGIRRSTMPQDFRQALLRHCLAEAAP